MPRRAYNPPAGTLARSCKRGASPAYPSPAAQHCIVSPPTNDKGGGAAFKPRDPLRESAQRAAELAFTTGTPCQ